jgi:hypothetical protein
VKRTQTITMEATSDPEVPAPGPGPLRTLLWAIRESVTLEHYGYRSEPTVRAGFCTTEAGGFLFGGNGTYCDPDFLL